MLLELEAIFTKLLVSWRCELIEFGGETDHVHLLIKAHPAMDLSKLVNNLKIVSSRIIRQRHKTRLVKFYRKPVFWHGAYYIGSVGNASLETAKRYEIREPFLTPP